MDELIEASERNDRLSNDISSLETQYVDFINEIDEQ